MAKKLTAAQVNKLVKTASVAIRKLTIDKLDHKADSNVKMSIDGLAKLSQRVSTTVLLRPRR